VLLHNARLWHPAAQATVDGDGRIRRHLRGWLARRHHIDAGHGLHDFVENAAR
jgi:hypothetical protein